MNLDIKLIILLVGIAGGLIIGYKVGHRPAETKIEYREKIVEVERKEERLNVKKHIEVKPDGTQIIDIVDTSVITAERKAEKNVHATTQVKNDDNYRLTYLVPFEEKAYQKPTIGVGYRLFESLWLDGQFNFKRNEILVGGSITF